MRMSTKGRFAVNAMIDLGLRAAGGPVPLAAICARQQVSLSYMEQLFSRLRRAGLVESTRGPGGGYTLGRALEGISLADIVAAVEDDLGVPAEGGNAALDLWARLDEVMLRHMDTVTLASLVAEQRERGVSVDDVRPVRRAIAPKPVVPYTKPRVANSVFAFARSLAGE